MNNDGLVELVVALTDRVVRTYQWQWLDGEADEEGHRRGHLAPMHKWEFAGHVGSITANRNADGTNALIVAQPGGALLRVLCRGLRLEDIKGEVESARERSPEEVMANIGRVDYEEMASYSMRNPDVTSEIVGGFGDGGSGEDSSPYAIGTLDGTLIFARNTDILWKLQVRKEGLASWLFQDTY